MFWWSSDLFCFPLGGSSSGGVGGGSGRRLFCDVEEGIVDAPQAASRERISVSLLVELYSSQKSLKS